MVSYYHYVCFIITPFGIKVIVSNIIKKLNITNASCHSLEVKDLGEKLITKEVIFMINYVLCRILVSSRYIFERKIQ